jgi:hypothetical protein
LWLKDILVIFRQIFVCIFAAIKNKSLAVFDKTVAESRNKF